MGERPTHPELLDHLATRFIQSGWSLKKLHREIMLSAVYQQGDGWHWQAKSASAERALAVDPESRLLWQMNPRRLEVEAWRDSMLTVAGNLDLTMGGPSTDLAAADNHRRTLYGAVSRHELNPLLRLFDFPDANITSDERPVTTVPLQQLFVLNSDFMIRNAKALAARLVKPEGDDAARIRRAYVLLYGREATEQEIRMGLEFVHVDASLRDATRASERLAHEDDKPALSRWEQYCQALLASNEFMYVD
jgi:hypothetical protein